VLISFFIPPFQYINAFDDANKRIGELVNTSKKFAAYLQGQRAPLTACCCAWFCGGVE
jgi:hypothetical protein